MNREFASEICIKHFHTKPNLVRRFSTGLANYVFLIQINKTPYVFRCNSQCYDDAVHWLDALHKLGIPVPRLVAQGTQNQLHYMITTYICGTELGELYPTLTDSDKRAIAKEVIQIQKQVARLELAPENNWPQWVQSMLQRARTRIAANGYFDVEKVDRLTAAAAALQGYFSSLHPVPYLDDISTKNLLILNGHVSGVIDVDWLKCGDPLTFAALTNVSLLNLQYDTVYVRYLLDELKPTPEQYHAFEFYSLLYCVDFMGERGTTFAGRTVKVDDAIIARLNSIYDSLWQQFHSTAP